MAAHTAALLCLAALGVLWGPLNVGAAFLSRGRHFITAFLENGGSGEPNFQLDVSPPPKGPPTAVEVRAQPAGAPPFRCALRLRPGAPASVRLPGGVELRGSRRAAGGAVRLTASRPVGVTVVNARGRSSLDTALALPRHLLGTQYVVLTPAPQPADPHAEFAVVAGARPTSLRLTPPVPVRLDGVEHAARQPIRVHLGPFQALQVQSAGDLSGTRVVATLPVALLAGHRCLRAGREVCGHVSEQLLPQSRWGRVYAVPPFAPAGPGPRDHVYVVAGSPGELHSWGSGAQNAHSLRPGAVLRLAVDPARPLVLRSSARLQVLFLAAAAARGGVAYDPFFALVPSVGAFGRSFALMALPGFSNVAVLVAREPTRVFLDQRPLPALRWRLIPADPESHRRQHSNQSQGFAWTEVAYGQGRGAVHRLETCGTPVGVLSFGTADGAGFGTQAMEQPTESSLARPPQSPGSRKDHACANGTTCRLVKDKPKGVPSTQASSRSRTMPNSQPESREDSRTVSIASSGTTTVAKPGPRSTPEAGLAPGAVSRPQPEPVTTVQPAHAPVLQPTSRAEPASTAVSKFKTASPSGPETVAKLGLQQLAETEPSLRAETVPEFQVVALDKSDTAAASGEGRGVSSGGTCWALGQPYVYTFDGYSFPVPGGCSYTLSHCPRALPSGLPAFRLRIACSGGGQPVYSVEMRVFGVTVSAVRHEFGFVRVNQQRLRLPATLGRGRLRLTLQGSELWAEAGLQRGPPALRLLYDWQHALFLAVAGSYRAHLQGLCGNFNGDPEDDAGGADPQALLHTWALQPPDAPCHALQVAPCTAPAPPLEGPGPCAILAAPNGPFSQCHRALPPAPFETSCRAWICPFPSHRPAVCLALQVYAHACQRLGVSVDAWRFQAGCPIYCPAIYSHYEACGSSCPETCAGPPSCPLPCGETCACEAGYVRSGPACVLQLPRPGACGCTYRGRRLAPGEALWEGVGCARRCICPASGGSVICSASGCRPGERCTLSRGLPACEPVGPATCVAAEGGHYITFDGRRFRFPGACAYLLSGLGSPAPDELLDFRVLLSARPDGAPRSLDVHVPGWHLRLQPEEPGRALVNGDWQNLPFQAPGNRTVIFRRGWDTVVSCSFGLRVTYAPGIRVALALPAEYGGHVVGLCADYNGDPTDDLQVPRAVASPELPEDALAWAFGHSWLVGSPAGCLDTAGQMLPLPPSCVTPSGGTPAHSPHVCDILLDSLGPFRLCHKRLVPRPYFQDCKVAVCAGTGPCPMLSLYCETCQLLGGRVLPWRKPGLCYPTCPAHAQYTLCTRSCPATCAGLAPPAGCEDPGRCREGCDCKSGFVLSGATCVPTAHCGCLRAGRYFEPGTPLPPLRPAAGACCRCQPGGRVACTPCQEAAGGAGVCLAWGDHYRTFDGTVFQLPGGACTYLLVGTNEGLPRARPFTVLLEKGPGTPEVRRVRLHAHGHHFSLDCQDWGHLTVDSVRHCLPFVLARGGARAFTQGESVKLVVPGGLWLLFGRDCRLSVGLPAAYRGLPQGLCGNFDGNGADDLQLPRPGPCMAPRPCPGSSCPGPAGDVGADARHSACGLLLQPGGPLAPCHARLPPEPFFQSCVANLGRARGNSTVSCSWLQAYVAACHVAGASVHPWRKPGLCSMQCPPHSHYSLCVNPSPEACPGLLEVVQSPAPCAEGCECDEGFFPAGGNCVPADSCSCFQDGQYFPPGQTVLVKNCSFSCTCQPGEGVTCVPLSCPEAEVCAVTDGVLGCRQQATLAPALNPVDSTLFFPPLLPGPQCPANSHFVPCGSACPATCANPSAPEHCSHPCAPACQCLPGHLLLGDRCVPQAHCSCFRYRGRPFWTDNCTRRCHCPALGPLASKAPQCWPDRCRGRCQVSTGGQQHCLLAQSPPRTPVPEEPLVCTATGDFHFHAFGGAHYEFPGSCVYRLVGLCGSAQANLEPFSVDLTPLLQPRGCTKALSLTACGLRLDMRPRDLDHIRVDGILESLPFFHGGCLRAFRQGYKLHVDTSFGLSLTYDWDSLARITLPRPYAPHLCGLCSPSAALPDTWKVAEVPGCSPVCGPLCPSPCPEAQRARFAGKTYCGLLSAAKGPLGPCYAALDPRPFFSDCLDDVCRQSGNHSTGCRALAAYSVACQALGVRLRPWRTPDFCPMRCPPHSHYALCGPCCPATCAGGRVCEAGGAGGGRCCEGCVCDVGFALSGASCVPAAQCGCFRAGRYRELGAVWYPGPGCARRCRCDPGGRVSCAPRPCGRGRVCGLRGGARRCLPDGHATCALAGPAHVLAFDGRAFTLPAPAPASPRRCLDVLARTTRPGAWPFSLDVARDGTGPLTLNLNLAGRRLRLDRHVVGVITVDGEHCRLPWALPGGQVWATWEGHYVVVHATCGLRLTYNWGSLVYLSVPSTFYGRLAGLCGAFGDDVDILDLPLDTGSWPAGPVATPCPLPQPNPGLSSSCPTPRAQTAKTPEPCGLLQAPDGPFGRCLGQLDPQPFLRMCLQDLCLPREERLGFCDALTAYTAACQEAGLPVLPWRGPKLCPLTCPPRRHYSICAQMCTRGCVLPAAPAQCSTRCYEGCECDPGLIFDGTDCVSQDRCGCFRHGRYIPVGEALTLPGCQEHCVCLRDQGLRCQPFSCPQGTDCILAGGIWSCEAGEGATCRLVPGGLFTTFDGFSGLAPVPVMPCAYNLAALVGSGPEDPDWFRVIADFPPCPGCPATQPWVIVNFRDGCAAVGPNQEIWVNGRPAQLPAPVCAGVVARWEAGSRVIIERTPSLRMQVGPEGVVALRASPTLHGRLRAACGDYNGVSDDDLRLPGGLPGASLGDVFQACRTRGFNSCTEKLVPPAMT